MGRHISTILITLMVTIIGPKALAYPAPVDFDGSLLRWDVDKESAPVLYGIEANDDSDLARYGSIIDDSADMWGDVSDSYFSLQLATPSETAQITVHLQKNIEMAASSGYTIFDETDDNGPVHCSIYIATGLGLSFTAVAKTILHELGHCIGLGHSLIPQAVMSYYFEDNAFELDLDDKAAITRLYPADGTTPKLPPGCSVGMKRSRGISALLLLIPLIFCFRFRAFYRLSSSL